MVASLNPDYGTLILTPSEPRIWLGGPSSNCWRMYYNASLGQWELDGGNGLVRYTQGSTFDCNGPNLFDVKIFDHTLQAPDAITVYPLTPLPCECPGMLDVERGVLNLTPYSPSIYNHMRPDLGILVLTPMTPEISEVDPGVMTDCSPSPIPSVLHVVCSSTDIPCVDGLAFDIEYNSDIGYWRIPGCGSGSATEACMVATSCPKLFGGFYLFYVTLQCISGDWSFSSAFWNGVAFTSSGTQVIDSFSNPPFVLAWHNTFAGSSPLIGRVDYLITG